MRWPGQGIVGLVLAPGHRERRTWATTGRAHIEVRAVDRPQGAEVAAAVEKALEARAGVGWARVNAALGRVVVAFDEAAVDVAQLEATVAEVEEAHGVGGQDFPVDRPDHPGDPRAAQRGWLALGADVAGLGVALVGQVLRLPALPLELASLVSLVDAEPRARQLVEKAVGRPATEVGLAVTNAATQAMAQSRLGPVVSAAHRLNLATESRQRARCWSAEEPRLCARPEQAGAEALTVEHAGVERPAPLPPGPVETYADRAGLASLGATGVALAVTGSPRRATGLGLAGLPKAGGMGREAFAAQLGRTLAGRGVVVVDPRALRRLDRLDTVVLDTEVLGPPAWAVDEIVPLGDAGTDELTAAFSVLYRPEAASQVVSGDGWWLGPCDQLTLRGRRGARARRDLTGRGADLVLGLARGRELVAMVGLRGLVDPAWEAMVAAVRRSECRLLLAGPAPPATSVGGPARAAAPAPARAAAPAPAPALAPALAELADEVVPGGDRLARTVRDQQAQGRGVALVSRDRRALAGADCGIGLTDGDGRPAWGAHLLMGPDMADVALVLDAIGTAREVSRRGVTLALAGASTGAVLTLTAPPRQGAPRALVGVNLAAATSQMNGTWSALQLGRRPLTPPVDPTPWHALDAQAVLAQLGSGPGGLREAEARRRHRPGQVPASPQATLVRAVLDELANPLTPVLAVGAGLSAALGSVTDAVLVGTVSAVSALLGGVQRLATERSVAQLLEHSAAPARVVRDGEERPVGAEELVEGDVIEVGVGDLVPADARVLEGEGLEVDESSLTGESFTVAKASQPVLAGALGDRRSMLYEGTTVAAGRGRAVVVATGSATQVGRAMATSRVAAPPTGVESRLATLNATSIPVALGAAGALVATGFLRGQPLADTLSSGVSLAVAAVPEGLPFLVTAAQLAAARRLSSHHALVKNPRTIEALGRAEVLCFDKTGTLTEGRLHLHSVSDGHRARLARELGDGAHRRVLTVALRATPRGRPGETLPHPTDQAIAMAGAELGLAGDDRWREEAVLGFEPARGFHASAGSDGTSVAISVKGAPEVVLPRCTQEWAGGRLRPLTSAGRRALDRELDGLARRGLRVLAVAERASAGDGPVLDGPGPGAGDGPVLDGPGPAGSALAEAQVRDLAFVGFVALGDRARTSAIEAVRRLQSAGVQLVMITGDHPSTAEAVAAELGLLNGGRVVTGPELDRMTQAELDRLLPSVAVFARVSPSHKVAIVRAFQRGGRAVAMTGDGANDAPAIRLADVGIALGRRGTPAARAAADLVVGDDRLETIVEALVEGRAMWGSVRDALAILLGGNLGEIGFTLLAGLVSGRSPLGTRQLLAVNLLTDLAPSLALALRPPAPGAAQALLAEGPERSLGSALNRQILVRATCTATGATLAWSLARATGGERRARTVALAAVVGTQLGQTLVLGRHSPAVAATAVASAMALVTMVQTPGVSQFFGCTPLGPVAWGMATGASTVATLGSVVVPRLLGL